MGHIRVLDDSTINKIAAGEVIERPSSIIKELVENSIDAGADDITIEVTGGGISSIRIIDNGKGIEKEDLRTAFQRHATSKLTSITDLYTISSLGFRGEALASIAAVSKVELMSRTRESIIGNRIIVNGGKIELEEECGCPEGTIISISDVFFNTPARLKFLKSESREGMYITSLIENLALSNTNISFKYKLNNKVILTTRGDGDLKAVLLSVYGKQVINNIIIIDGIKDFIKVKGFIGNSSISKNSRNNQSIYINGRFVKNKTVTAAVEAAFKSMLTINKFPFFVLAITVNPEFIDVNVHPTKAEVKFQDEQIVFKAVYHCVKEALLSEPGIKDAIIMEEKPAFAINVPKLNYTQETMDFRGEISLTSNDINKEVVQNKDKEAFLPERNMPLQDTSHMCDRTYEKTPDADKERKHFDISYAGVNEKLTKVPKFEPLAVIGQLHFMYIIAEGMEEMYLIDQHAAHERVYYEKYLEEYNQSHVQSQNLMVPIVIELSLSEKHSVLQNNELFTRLGYEIEDFGGNSISLRAIPVIYGNPNAKELFYEIIEEMDLNSKDILHSIDKVFYTMACKSAIKAGDKLTLKEMSELIEQLRTCDNPFNCPHGRPTIIKMSYYELEKKFKRIQ